MAWLQNIAGKAENLLVKIDKNAATVLNDSQSNEDIQSELFANKTPQKFKGMKLKSTKSKVSEALTNTEIQINSTSQESLNQSNNSSFTNLLTIVPSPTSISSSEINNSSLSKLQLTEKDQQELQSLDSNVSLELIELKQTYEDRIVSLESQNFDLSKELLDLQHLYNETKTENNNIKSQIEYYDLITEQAQNEMNVYKARVQRIFAEKERLMEEGISTTKNDNSDVVVVTNKKLEEELCELTESNKILCEKLDTSQNEQLQMREKWMALQKNYEGTICSLQKQIFEERSLRSKYLEEIEVKNNEKRDLTLQIEGQIRLVEEQNQEILHLKSEITKNLHSSNTNDLERRLSGLNQTLLNKQQCLENVTAERNSLRLRLEEIEIEYQNILQTRNADFHTILVSESDSRHYKKATAYRNNFLSSYKAFLFINLILVKISDTVKKYPVITASLLICLIFLHITTLFALLKYMHVNK